mmetsp:Transcript_29929/g.84400  ORF Transcript_29929/g.84400 Transcript_29929/m.84400 type:complete len:259 (+) Transcript_29929:1870-2646(+)
MDKTRSLRHWLCSALAAAHCLHEVAAARRTTPARAWRPRSSCRSCRALAQAQNASPRHHRLRQHTSRRSASARARRSFGAQAQLRRADRMSCRAARAFTAAAIHLRDAAARASSSQATRSSPARRWSALNTVAQSRERAVARSACRSSRSARHSARTVFRVQRLHRATAALMAWALALCLSRNLCQLTMALTRTFDCQFLSAVSRCFSSRRSACKASCQAEMPRASRQRDRAASSCWVACRFRALRSANSNHAERAEA